MDERRAIKVLLQPLTQAWALSSPGTEDDMADTDGDRFAGKVAFVTGGGGIGRATALAFAAEGASLVVTDVAEDGARETARQIEQHGGRAPGGNVRCHPQHRHNSGTGFGSAVKFIA